MTCRLPLSALLHLPFNFKQFIWHSAYFTTVGTDVRLHTSLLLNKPKRYEFINAIVCILLQEQCELLAANRVSRREIAILHVPTIIVCTLTSPYVVVF